MHEILALSEAALALNEVVLSETALEFLRFVANGPCTIVGRDISSTSGSAAALSAAFG